MITISYFTSKCLKSIQYLHYKCSALKLGGDQCVKVFNIDVSYFQFIF